MQFGYFDDARREYVVTRPDTPRPWSDGTLPGGDFPPPFGLAQGRLRRGEHGLLILFFSVPSVPPW